MRFSARQETLLAMLKAVRTVAGKAHTAGVPAGVCLRSRGDGRLEMAATDGQTGVRLLSLPNTDGTEPGAAVLSASMFGDFIATLGPGSVECTASTRAPNMLEVSYMGGRGKAHFATFGDDPALFETYQAAADSNWAGKWSLPASVFRSAVGQVDYACNLSLGYALAGVRVILGGGEMRLVGLDNFRIATRTVSVSGDGEATFTVPVRAMAIAKQVLTGNGEVTIGLLSEAESPRVQLAGEGDAGTCVEVTTASITERYPDWQRFTSLPPLEARCDTGTVDLIAGIGRIEKVVRADGSVRFNWPAAGGGLALTGKEREAGSCETVLDADTIGEGNIAMGAGFLLEFLRTVESDRVSIGLVEAGSMVMGRISAVGLEHGEHLYVLAPRYVPD